MLPEVVTTGGVTTARVNIERDYIALIAFKTCLEKIAELGADMWSFNGSDAADMAKAILSLFPENDT